MEARAKGGGVSGQGLLALIAIGMGVWIIYAIASNHLLKKLDDILGVLKDIKDKR